MNYIINRIRKIPSFFMPQNFDVPVVMSFSINDPTGGAGIHADIETLFGLSCRAAAVVTAITAQNSSGTSDYDYVVTPTRLIIEQARAALEELPIAGFKIGVVKDVATLAAIHTILKDYPNLPIVCSVNSEMLGTQQNPNLEMRTAIASLICPLSTVLIVDTVTAQILTPGADNLDACAQKLMEYGSEYVFIKNCDETRNTITNALYSNHRLLEKFQWERIPGDYRGCGCTFSAALTGLLAHGLVTTEAVAEAQKYTLSCIQQGTRMGVGFKFLSRIFGLGNI